ncbi:ABC transporter ATP-binding protein [Mesobacterium sp. TK19101]|uniref:ABC transporter ATP-binding protein n=1 Tax=Mesobacterium hydrothermale TaxID=3111907 RepID=A0ABU6HKZ4_9RHOB|nr:ABC transporter ATP-binding protein [Mesobacterium sp. TK19101]MEC3862966.1 ABC transporter ATP-binding protein [Mesobacterium sp. TK19101]
MSAAPAIHVSGHHELAGQPLFAPVDLTLPAGQWTCVLGRSGVGKSTLLRLVAGLECAGEFRGQITASDAKPLDGRISFMAQSDLLLPWLSVYENVVLGSRLRGSAPDVTLANDLLDRVGLATHRGKPPSALSGGMRQRAALARTLMEDRPVALLDEPFSALDASTRADMQELSARMLQGKTVLVVTHDPAEAVRLGHQIVVLTPMGANLWQPPNTFPVRDQYAPETIACQAALLSHLRGAR